MNSDKILRNTFIFTLWTLIYFAWFRWFMLVNWDFNIFLAEHWQFIGHQWWYGGWVIKGSYYWLFVLSLFLCLPMWICGLCFFVSIPYSKYLEKAFWDSIYKRKTKAVQTRDTRIRIKKKKSYKEVRPRPLSGTPQIVASVPAAASTATPDWSVNAPEPTDLFMKEGAMKGIDSFSHREITDDFEGASPFETAENGRDSSLDLSEQPNLPVVEDFEKIMQSAGATLIKNAHLGAQTMDYIALAKDSIFYVLMDSEKGDWLADEERFNDEDPLWFSETSHRVSPITSLKKFEVAAKAKLDNLGLSLDSHIILVKTDGNIINAEDMQDTWKEMGVLVARSDLGMPEELPLFGETFPSELTAQEASDTQKINAIFNS